MDEIWKTTRTIGYVLKRNSKAHPDKIAFIYPGKRVTYREFNENVNKLANGLVKAGIKKGDRIALLSLNSIEFMEIFYAAGKIGTLVVPINVRFTPYEIEYVVNDSTPKMFFVGKEHAKIVENAMKKLDPNIKYVLINGTSENSNYISYAELRSENKSEPDEQVYDYDSLIIMYSSGTTGKPKGCVLTHENIFEASIAFKYEWDFKKDDIMVAVMPLFHIAALGLVFAMVQVGGTTLILPKFDPTLLSKQVYEEKATILGLLPTAARLWFNHPSFKEYSYDSLRIFITYGADVILKAKDLFPNAIITEYYGCTECTGMIALNNHTAANYSKVKSCGKPAIHVNVAIIDENGNLLPPGKVGEIVARGPTIMKEYWKRSKDTEEVFRGGWFHTGDAGYIDDDGYLHIVDRLKDMIRSGGENIYSREVEEVILMHPAVKEVAVIGVPDPVWGESVKAFIVLKEGMSATEEEIIEHVKKYLASYKKPKYIEFVDSLPKTSSGRVMKYVLRERELHKK